MLTKLSLRRSPWLSSFLGLCILGSVGCANAPRDYAPGHYDPLEKVNRGVFKFNSGLDKILLRPVAKGYQTVLPRPVRTGVRNFFSNLRYPITIVNDVLQFKLKQAAADTGRLVINTTLGLGGIMDPATEAGLKKNQEDLGQTLAVWGVPAGPYIYLPLLGPTTLRDGPAMVADRYVDPLWQYDGSQTGARDRLLILSVIQLRESLLVFDDDIKKAFDPYTFVKNTHRQFRRSRVFDGDPPEEDLEDDFLDDDEDLEDYEPSR